MAKRTSDTRNLVDFLSYIAILLIGVALLFVMLSSVGVTAFDGLKGICTRIAEIIAYALIGWNSYFYARAKGTKHWRWIVWLIAIVLIIVVYVVSIFA